MSQQLQQPPTQQVQQQPQTSQQSYQPGQGGQQSMQQFGQQGQQGQQGGQRFEEAVPSEVRLAVEDLERITTISEWAKTKAAERGLHKVVRASNDIENLAELQKKLIVRQSPVAQTVGQCVTQGLQQSIQELQQYAQDPTVQEELTKVQGSLQNVQQATQRVQQLAQQGQGGQMGQQGQQGGQMGQSQIGGTQQSGGQQFGGGIGQQY